MACPLVSLLAAVHNLAAMRSQSHKLCLLYQRPMLPPSEEFSGGMGCWSSVLRLMVNASVATNCALVFFSMSSAQRWFPEKLDRVLLFFAAEHVFFVLDRMFDSLVSTTSQQILDEHAREQHQKTIRDQHEQRALGMHTLDPGRVHLCQEPWQSSGGARRQSEY